MNEYEALGFLYIKVKVAPSDCDDYVKAMNVITSFIAKYVHKPALQPSKEWIPCSEKLPKRDEMVLVSYRGEVHFCKYLDDGSENAWWSYVYDSCIWNKEVVAWMPLPIPKLFKEEGD